MYNRADLHLHTTASDGKLSPKELASDSLKADLDIIAITDHDTTSGVEDGIKYGGSIGIKVIPGIELSTSYNNESIHILGYFRDDSYKNMEFQNTLQELINYRVKRGKKIVSNLFKYFHIRLDYENILKEAKGVIARPHIAKAIVDSGYNYTWDYIFENLIGSNSPAYVPKKNLTIEEGISLLKSTNALVVLAHPILLKKTPIEELLKFPFDGIEAIYPLNRESDTKTYIEIAEKHQVLITAGSDFHGISQNDSSHGTIGCVYLSRNNLDIFMKRYNSISNK